MDIDFARPIFEKAEKDAVTDVLRGHLLASGKWNAIFERDFADLHGTRFAVCVNSGSSANLLALASFDLPKGSRVITSGCGFPATLAPILPLGLEPVLVVYAYYDQANYDLKYASIPGALPELRTYFLPFVSRY